MKYYIIEVVQDRAMSVNHTETADEAARIFQILAEENGCDPLEAKVLIQRHDDDENVEAFWSSSDGYSITLIMAV